jgi:predicted  nucleic acid-binding Zn-ribbon protein
MKSKFTGKRYWLLILFICAGLGLTAKNYRADAANEPAPSMAQDAIMLDRRISALEQRLYTIESRISRVEQQSYNSSRSTPIPSPSTTLRDPETALLRSEVETLKARVRELECGLVHIDERTLPASAKQAQKSTAGQSQDPCRQNPQAPVRLSMRP